MRTFILTVATVFGLLMLPATPAGTAVSNDLSFGTAVTLDAHSLQDAPKAPQINVEVNRGGGRAWYMNPVWIAIGAIAFVVLVVLLVMASKGGGGTTVVRG